MLIEGRRTPVACVSDMKSRGEWSDSSDTHIPGLRGIAANAIASLVSTSDVNHPVLWPRGSCRGVGDEHRLPVIQRQDVFYMLGNLCGTSIYRRWNRRHGRGDIRLRLIYPAFDLVGQRDLLLRES